ncbi:MAG: bifunctional (p)ppGpp synthetase/guanosine-3',5'-bis(diphosphate) 3'-pyrophosphohydrolase [Candidatus Muiribacteriota bacterium]
MKILLDKVKSYNKFADFALIEKAYYFAQEHHKKQIRKSGEPYFIHPYNVALIICDLKLDTASICAGLLHDIIEDTEINYDTISKEFSPSVAHIVDGVTKISKLIFKTREEQEANNLRKMLFAMIEDIRVILVKLADRLHNMKTLDFMKPEKQKLIARETLEIYAPLAHRLGIYVIKSQLEDLCLKYIDPELYQSLKDELNKEQQQRNNYINEIINSIKDILTENEISDFSVYGRTKHFFSIYRKMKFQNKSLNEIYDLIGIRVITDSVKDCYAALGFVHKLWPPIPGRFKDYVAMPKTNFYQSLHTTIMHPMGFPVEFQIRTQKMHDIAEVGIAAHFEYKEKEQDSAKDKVMWLRQLLEWHKDIDNDSEFLESVKIDLFQDEVFIFTPEGDIKSLASGSTPLDFAFSVHTEVGSHCTGAKVNGKIVPLSYELQNGDIVEIITSPKQTPKREWLDIAKTSRAKNKIRAYLRKALKDVNIEKGKESYSKYIDNITEKYPDILEEYPKPVLLAVDKVKKIKNILEENKLESIDEFYAAVALKSLNLKSIFYLMFPKVPSIISSPKTLQKFKEIKSDKEQAVSLGEIDQALIKFSKCCNPIPYDEITGFITMGKGISIHKATCPNIKDLIQKHSERIIKLNWNAEAGSENVLFNAKLRLETIDRPKLLSEVTQIISQMDINISDMSASINKKRVGIIDLGIQIKHINELNHVISTISQINGVHNVFRIG